MPEPKNPALLSQLMKLGQETTPGEMQKRGVRRVVSLSTRDVSDLIERAINRTLMERTIGGVDAQESGALRERTEQHFLSQIAELEELADSRALLDQHRKALHAELAELKGELAARSRAAERPAEPQADPWPVHAERWRELRGELHARLAPVFALAGAQAPPLRASVDELLDLFAAERARSLDELRGQAQIEIDVLERRVAKLIASAEETEVVLGRLATARSLDQGIESIYRHVQGLEQSAADRERRLAILTRIFEKNAELRRELPAAD